jgi:hypothetical protein
MTLKQKQEIAATARTLIRLLDNCDDGDFVDQVIECVASNDPYLIEVERL